VKLGILLIAAALFLPQSVPIHELAATLDGRYNSIHSWQADFTQIYEAGLSTRTESGHIFLEKPGKMRWDYQVPQKKVFLVAGDTVWQYTAGDRDATRTSIKNSSDLRTPLRFLLGHTDLNKELADLSYSGLEPIHAGDYVIHGRPPEGEAAGWREVWIECTSAYEIDRLVIGGLDGSRNDIRFSRVEPNRPLPKGIFNFQVPAGVLVVAGG